MSPQSKGLNSRLTEVHGKKTSLHCNGYEISDGHKHHKQSLLQPLQTYVMYFSNVLTNKLISHGKIKGINTAIPVGRSALCIRCGQLPALAPHAGKKTTQGEKPLLH